MESINGNGEKVCNMKQPNAMMGLWGNGAARKGRLLRKPQDARHCEGVPRGSGAPHFDAMSLLR